MTSSKGRESSGSAMALHTVRLFFFQSVRLPARKAPAGAGTGNNSCWADWRPCPPSNSRSQSISLTSKGGKQTALVQHVHMSGGGQAVVAESVGPVNQRT